MIKRIRQKFREVDDNFEEIENYPGFGYRWRPADEASPVADRTDRGYDAGYPMPGRVPGPARHMHNGGNGQIPTRVVDAISQLPYVRSVTTWRRRKLGRAHVSTPATNAHLVCRLLLEKKQIKHRLTLSDTCTQDISP